MSMPTPYLGTLALMDRTIGHYGTLWRPGCRLEIEALVAKCSLASVLSIRLCTLHGGAIQGEVAQVRAEVRVA